MIFAPLVALTILFGVVPKPVLDMSAASVTQLLDRYGRAVKAAEQNARGQGRRPDRQPRERCPMNEFANLQALLPLLPEFMLGVGAHASC